MAHFSMICSPTVQVSHSWKASGIGLLEAQQNHILPYCRSDVPVLPALSVDHWNLVSESEHTFSSGGQCWNVATQDWLHHVQHQMLSLLLPGGAVTEKTVSGTCSADISPSSLPGTVLHKQESQLLQFQTLITINMTRKVQINGLTHFQTVFCITFH
jgi:hypothetical protein